MTRTSVILLACLFAFAAQGAMPTALRGHVPHSKSNHRAVVINQFAVPVAVPVSPLSVYAYTTSDAKRQAYAASPKSADDILAERIAEKVARILQQNDATYEPPTLFAQKCAACHSPQAAAHAADGRPTLPPLYETTDVQRLVAIREIIAGRMPKGAPLSSEETTQLIEELTSAPPLWPAELPPTPTNQESHP